MVHRKKLTSQGNKRYFNNLYGGKFPLMRNRMDRHTMVLMAPQSDSGGTSILARQVPQSIRFLRELGVRGPRIAGIFGETADSIRHIDNRAYAKAAANLTPILIDKKGLALLRLNIRGIRLRTKQDLDQAEADIWAIFQSHQSVGLEEGYEALLAMLPSVANARHGKALKVRLLLEEKLAWFALPLGRIETALGHAGGAMRAACKAFRESAGEKAYLLRYAEAALIASICLQKLHEPERAFAFIRATDEANRAAGQLPGSEHLRQRGA